MRKNISIWMLGIAAMLASCSQEEILQDATSHKNVTTITATVSDGMKTRATPASDEELAAIHRCKLVVYAEGETTNPVAEQTVREQSNNSFTFTLDLDEGNYDFYCWADDGTSYNLDNGLGSITVATTTGNKPGIAHEGKVLAQKSGEPVTIPLQHAVAKVVLQTTADITADKPASVTVQTHTGYSVFDEKVTASTSSITETKAIATTGATEANPTEVLSFYVLVDKDEEPQASVTVAYGDDKIKVANVPIKADCRIVLKGDLTSLAYPETTVTATLDTDWDEETKGFPVDINATTHTITLAQKGKLTEEDITAAIGEGSELIISGDNMNEDDFTTLKTWMYELYANDDKKLISITLEDVTSLPDRALFMNEDEEYGVNNLYVLKLPKVTTIGNNAICLYNMEELWITAKGNITDNGWAATAFNSSMKLYVNEDKKEGGNATPTVTYNDDYGFRLYWWGTGASQHIYYVNDAGEIVE